MPDEDGAERTLKDLPYFLLNLCFSGFIILIQLAGGIYSGSQALIADTAHVFVHASTEVVVILSLWSGSKKLDRLGSWLIVLLLLALLVPWLIWSAYQRYLNPEGIAAPLMFGATLVGLLINIAQRLIVRGRGLSSKSVAKYKLCLNTDIYSSLGVLAGAAMIYLNPAWLIADTILALLIAVWVILKALKML